MILRKVIELKKIVSVVILLMVATLISSCKKTGDFPLDKVKQNIVVVEAKDTKTNKRIAYATGFLILHKNDTYCVTAAHTYYEAEKYARENNITLKYDITSPLLSPREDRQLHVFGITKENDRLDTWIIKITPRLENVSLQVKETFKEQLLPIGTKVAFCGLPLEFQSGGKILYEYILRECIIAGAFPINLPDISKNLYIIDSLVNPGDSGSPVFTLDSGHLVGFVRGCRYYKKYPNGETGLGEATPICYVVKLIDQKLAKTSK